MAPDVVTGLFDLGCTPEGIGRYCQRQGASLPQFVKALLSFPPDLRQRLNSGYRSRNNDRNVEHLIVISENRLANLELSLDGSSRKSLEEVFSEVKRVKGISIRYADGVAGAMNAAMLSLSWMSTILVALGASPANVNEFMKAVLGTWDVDQKHSDTANAKRLEQMFGPDLHYVRGIGWYVWDGSYWYRDELDDVQELAKTIGRTWQLDAAIIRRTVKYAIDGKEAMSIRYHATSNAKIGNRSESAGSIKATLNLAKSSAGIALPVERLDSDPFVLNVRNGTIDLRTGELREHRRSDLLTSMAPVDYDPEATSSAFDSFLEQSTGGDSDLVSYIQRAFGLTLFGEMIEEVFFVMYGPGGSGKSTLLEAVRSVLGGYAKTTDFETFVKKKGGDSGIRNDIARLRGARLVTSVEVDEGRELAGSQVKMMTGGDTITARYLYQEFFDFKLSCTIVLAVNDAPEIDGTDSGLARRMKVIPFAHAVAPEDRDPNLKRFLTEPDLAGPAILAWLVRGCLAYQREGLGTCAAVEAAGKDYRETMDVVGRFIEDRCELDDGAWAASGALYDCYRSWAGLNGEVPILSSKGFANKLQKKGLKPTKRGGSRGREGIRISLESSWVRVPSVVPPAAALPPGEMPS